MTQHRLYLHQQKPQAHIVYNILGVEFEEDGIPVSMFEVDGENDIWCVAIYCAANFSNSFEARMICALDVRNINVNIECEIIKETNWVAKALRQLSPVRAGRFLVHGSHDNDAAKFNDFAIKIDAGMAFGTGHHGTTAGCLDVLVDVLKYLKFRHCLDLGTGSGVLAIAIAKATKGNIIASDIDPVATKVARQNARINGVYRLLTCLTATGFNHPQIKANAPYDLIIANILARPLRDMAADFARHLAPGAIVILSGLLPHQKTAIIASFKIQNIVFVKAHIRDGWLTLLMRV